MSDKNPPLIIDYYSDLLCVWAWIAERRIEELEAQWGDRIVLRHQFLNVFGDTTNKMATQWSERGGYEGFARHVASSAADYEDAPVNADLWLKVRPLTSANAHLVLKAVELAESPVTMVQAAGHLRRAFFLDAVDIGPLQNVYDLISDLGLRNDAIRGALDTGAAMAALMSDYGNAERKGIAGSPSWVMNEGRQVLFGNVGYRVLNANIEELLRHPGDEASWC